MKTKLIEFPNCENQSLRGLLTIPNEIGGGVICLHGFEGTSTAEKKFKTLSDELGKNKSATLRLDFSGCGISDGDFKLTTIDRQGAEFLKAIEVFLNETGLKSFDVVAHSLGACVLAGQLENIKDKVRKIILIAPALNQKQLLRYWFVVKQLKKSNPDIEINWDNYRDQLDEEEFIADCMKPDKMAKANYINSAYFQIGKDLDFSHYFADKEPEILHVHGSNDATVPLESLNINFKKRVVVDGGEHYLERPDLIEQWMPKAVEFLSN